MYLDTQFEFYSTHTVINVEGLRLVYVLAENVRALNDEMYDHAFVLFKAPEKTTLDWRKIKNEDRKNIHLKAVRRPSSYINGCSLLMPKHIQVERDEVLVRVEEDHVARLFSYSIQGKRFVPHHLRERVVVGKEESDLKPQIYSQPLIDINILPCPAREVAENQIPLI